MKAIFTYIYPIYRCLGSCREGNFMNQFHVRNVYRRFKQKVTWSILCILSVWYTKPSYYIYIYIYLIGSEIKNWMITMITVDGRHPAPGDKCSLFHYLQSLEQNAWSSSISNHIESCTTQRGVSRKISAHKICRRMGYTIKHQLVEMVNVYPLYVFLTIWTSLSCESIVLHQQ